MHGFLNRVNSKALSDEQKNSLDKKLTSTELFKALKTMKKNKTPGNDGLTGEFYLSFWPLLEKGPAIYKELATLISLINVDVKIVSKAIAKNKSLEPILSIIVHHTQNGFVKGRSIFDAVRTIDDVLEFAEIANKSGILLARWGGGGSNKA